MEDRLNKTEQKKRKKKRILKSYREKIYMEDRWDIQLCIQKTEQSQAHKKYSKCNSRKFF